MAISESINTSFVAAQEAQYRKLLGLSEVPKTPADIPLTIFLPPQFTSPMSFALQATLDRDLEHFQGIYWNSFKQEIDTDNLKVGNEENGGLRNYLENFLSILLRDKKTIFYHTHIRSDEYRRDTDFFGGRLSKDDILRSILIYSSAYINLAVSDDVVSAILQTRQFMEYDDTDIMNIYRILNQVGLNHFGIQELQKELEKVGLGYYQFQITEVDWSRDKMFEELKKGVNLTNPSPNR